MTECDPDEVEDCNVTLLTKEVASTNEIIVLESLGSAVIDTACTQTVCGEKWFNLFCEEVNEAVPKVRSWRAFKFGDGRLVYSFQHATKPAIIGGTRCSIETEIVKSDIPLLLSNSSLKKAETVLDLKNDHATMFNQPVNLEFTSSGHYCVKIIKDQHKNKNHLSNEEEIQEV